MTARTCTLFRLVWPPFSRRISGLLNRSTAVAAMLLVALSWSAETVRAESAPDKTSDGAVPVTVAAPGTASSITDPGKVGLSAARLSRLTSFLEKQVQQAALPGVVVAIARRGQPVYLTAVGYRDRASAEPMPLDAVFDLSWLSKPVTAAAAMILHEQGDWLLSDRVGRHLEPFGERRISLLDLMRQSSGLPTSLPDADIRNAAGLRLRDSAQLARRVTGKQFVARMAGAGASRPAGQVAQADFSYDLLGLAIEAASEQTLGAFLLRELFIPLDLWDTGFYPPPSAATRLAIAVNVTAAGAAMDTVAPRNLTTPLGFECGAGCLTSTASNYLRFVQLLLNDGQIDDIRLLAPGSVRYLTENRLAADTDNRLHAPDEITGGSALSGVGRTFGSSAFGAGLGVVVRPDAAADSLPGSAGEFSVSAPTGPYFWADRTQQLAVVMLGYVPDPSTRLRLQRQLRSLVHQAIEN